MSLMFRPSFRHMEGELKVESSMDSSSFCDNQLQEQHQQQQSSTLTRYRSAPSSFFESLLNGNDDDLELGCDDFNDFLRASSPEADAVIARMVSTTDSGKDLNVEGNRGRSVKEELGLQQHDGFSMDQKTLCGDIGNSVQARTGNESQSNLIRQSSSPAGFFTNITAENGSAATKDEAKFGACTESRGGPTPAPRSSKVNGCLSFSSGQIYGYNSEIAEIGANGNSSCKYYVPDFPNKFDRGTSLSGLKRIREDDTDLPSRFSMSKHPGNVMGVRNTGLTHHLSLPKNFGETASVEILHFQDSVPCKIRAKRGFATHPRSIAERVRRGRISERMKKLQELFPNMDKQANTADMLDMALESIKDLQNQVKILREKRAGCICASKQE